jgi:hypothetical protein
MDDQSIEQVKKLYEVLGGDISISVEPAQDKQAGLDLRAA